MKRIISLFLVLIAAGNLYSQKCKVADKYYEPKDLYNEKGEIVLNYYIVYPTTTGHGISDANGNLVVTGNYDETGLSFFNGKVLAKNYQKKLVDLWDLKTKAKIRLPAISAGDVIGDNGLIAIQAATKKWGYCDVKGKMVIPAKFDYAETFKGNKAIVQSGDNYGIVNTKGAWIIQPQKLYYRWVSPGLLLVEVENKSDGEYYGLMDTSGKIVEPAVKYTSFEDRQGIVELKLEKNKGALFNSTGKKLTGDECYVKDGDYKANINNGLLVVNDSKGFAFVIDTAGKRYLENKYSYIHLHKHYVTQQPTGLFTVQTSQKEGSKEETYAIVKMDGTVVLDGAINNVINYDADALFISVRSGDTETYTLKKADGTVIAKDVCNDVVAFHKQYAFVRKNGKYGAINMQTGEWAIPLEYKNVTVVDECTIKFIDAGGKEIFFSQELKIIK